MSAQPFGSTLYAAAVAGNIPPRKLNGGLYTGEPFAGDWGNRPLCPDAGAIENMGMFWHNKQVVSADRIGNNRPDRVNGRVAFAYVNATFPDHQPSPS